MIENVVVYQGNSKMQVATIGIVLLGKEIPFSIKFEPKPIIEVDASMNKVLANIVASLVDVQ